MTELVQVIKYPNYKSFKVKIYRKQKRRNSNDAGGTVAEEMIQSKVPASEREEPSLGPIGMPVIPALQHGSRVGGAETGGPRRLAGQPF